MKVLAFSDSFLSVEAQRLARSIAHTCHLDFFVSSTDQCIFVSGDSYDFVDGYRLRDWFADCLRIDGIDHLFYFIGEDVPIDKRVSKK